MKRCISCGELTVDVEEPPRYDVLRPDFEPDASDLADFGPYGPECWGDTVTAQAVSDTA